MDVFVYGTLTDSERAEAVLDDVEFVGEATLLGLHRVHGAYPTLAPGGQVEGELLRTSAVDRLDAYEGVERGLYVRLVVPRADREAGVAVYVGDPDRLGVSASWPGDGPFEQRVRRYVKTHDVVVRTHEDRQD